LSHFTARDLVLGQPSSEQPRGAGKGEQADDGERQEISAKLGEAGALQVNSFGEVQGVEKRIDDHDGLKEIRHAVDRCGQTGKEGKRQYQDESEEHGLIHKLYSDT
jgi:hypothetical protein